MSGGSAAEPLAPPSRSLVINGVAVLVQVIGAGAGRNRQTSGMLQIDNRVVEYLHNSSSHFSQDIPSDKKCMICGMCASVSVFGGVHLPSPVGRSQIFPSITSRSFPIVFPTFLHSFLVPSHWRHVRLPYRGMNDTYARFPSLSHPQQEASGHFPFSSQREVRI